MERERKREREIPNVTVRKESNTINLVWFWPAG